MPYLAQIDFFVEEAAKCRRMAEVQLDPVARLRWIEFAAEYDRLIEENGSTPPRSGTPDEAMRG